MIELTIDEQIQVVENWYDEWKLDAVTMVTLPAILRSLKELKALQEAASSRGQENAVPVESAGYQDFVNAYLTWHEQCIGVPAQMDARQGKALKEIIKYVKYLSHDKSESGGLLVWQYILSNWGKLSDFLKGQTTLVRINANKVEICAKLKKQSDGKRKQHNALEQLRRAAGK
jgi:hypothetical protein